MKLAFLGGTLQGSGSAPFIAVTDPAGNSLIGAPGWSFNKDGDNSLTVTHPKQKWFINFNRFAQTSFNGTEWVSANFSGGTFNAASVKNYTNQGSFTLIALNSGQTGISTSQSGTVYMFITWQEPSRNFYS